MGGRQSHVDMHGIEWTHDTAAAGTLEEAQRGQHLHMIMNAPAIACHAAVIAFAALVVKPDHPHAVDRLGCPVLEAVSAWA